MRAKYVAVMLAVLLMTMLALGVQAWGPEDPTGSAWEPPLDGEPPPLPNEVTVASSEDPSRGGSVDTEGELTAQSTGIWQIEVVDSATGGVGAYTSLVLDAIGYPHISYYDGNGENLKYAYWTGTAWTVQTVDGGLGTRGAYSSLALDSEEHPHISYFDDTHNDVKYAHWTGTAWDIQTVDSQGGVGCYTSLALDSLGRPHIAYGGYYNLRYASWTGAAWTIQTVDDAGYVGSASLVLDSADHPHISNPSSGYPSSRLKYAYWSGSEWVIDTVDETFFVTHTSLVLDSEGHPHISYEGDGLYAHWTGTEWIVESVSGIEGNYSSIALDGAGHPCVSTYDLNPDSDLVYLRRQSEGWIVEVVDSGLGNSYAGLTSLALGERGYPYISYIDNTNKTLKYARLKKTLSETIPPSGGSVTSPLRDVRFVFPSGAVTTTTVLTYTEQDALPTGPLADIGYFFDLTAVYSDTGQPAQIAPDATYTIVVTYTRSGPAIEDTLGLYWWDGSAWSQQGITSTVDITDNVVTSDVDHFSRFAVLGETRRVFLPVVLKNH